MKANVKLIFAVVVFALLMAGAAFLLFSVFDKMEENECEIRPNETQQFECTTTFVAFDIDDNPHLIIIEDGGNMVCVDCCTERDAR